MSGPLRVLHVIPSIGPEIGGATTALDDIVRSQRAAGLLVRVLATADGEPGRGLAPALEAVGVGCREIAGGGGPLTPHPALAEALEEEVARCDAIHTHGVWELCQHLAAAAATRRGLPRVVTPHGMLDPWPLKQGALKKRLYLAFRLRADLASATGLHATSRQEAQNLRALVPGVRVEVVPLGLDLAEFATLPDADAFGWRVPAVADRPYLLFLSRLHPKKGVELLIGAFARLLRHASLPPGLGERLQLVVAGPPHDDGYLTSLRALSKRHSVADRTHFVGPQLGAERVEAFAGAAAFVLPSAQENFGIVVAEAAAAGIPQVVTGGVDLSTFVAEHGLGRVVEREESAVAEGLAAVLQDPWTEADRQRARAAARSAFDREPLGRRWANLYGGLAGRAAA